MAESNVSYDVAGPEVSEDLDVLNDETPAETPTEEAEDTTEVVVEEETEEEAPEEETEETEEEPEEGKETKKPAKAETEEVGTLHASLKKKFPNIFKEVPQLKQVLFREEKYSEYFPTPDDAKDAQERLEVFAPIESGLLKGSANELVISLGNTDKKVLEKVASDFLPQLYQHHQEAFYKAVDPVVKQLLNAAIKKGRESKDQNLEHAARHLSKFVFDTYDVPAPEAGPQRREQDPDRIALEEEKKEFAQQRFNVNRQEILQASVGSVIVGVQKQIDPENKLTPFMKDTLVQKVMEEVDKVIASDQKHMNAMASLWRRAMKANFPPEWKTRIQNTYLARARQVVPTALIKVRKEAGLGVPKAQQRVQQVVQPTGHPAAGRPVPRRVAGPVDSKRVDFSKTSDMDILNDRVTLKG